MKKFCLLCLMLSVLAGCTVDEPVRLDEADGPVFHAVAEAVSMPTRTSLGGDLSSFWSAGDEIAVFAGRSSADRYVLDPRSAGCSGGYFALGQAGDEAGADVATNIAVYPYREGLSVSANGSVYRFSGFAYPVVQAYAPGSFAEGAYAMVAVGDGTDDYSLDFRNVGGAVRLQLLGSVSVSRIVLRGNAGEKLSGEALLSVGLDGDVPSVVMGDDADDHVVLDCGAGVQLNPVVPVSFYLAVPPVEFAEGFTVEVEAVDGESDLIAGSACNKVGRSQILAMPAVKVFAPAEADGDYIDEYGVNRGQGVVINGLRWAPVNCGYREAVDGDKGFAYGKLYQWGRLYGLGYNTANDASAADNQVGGSITIAEANVPANSNVFYTMSSGNNQSHWFSDTVIDGVWNSGTTESPVKSGFDPCPPGWRLPTQPEMKGLSSNRSEWTEVDGQKGYWFSGSQAYAEGVPAIFLSAPGYIANNGRAQQRNSFGRYWTSTVRTSDNLIHHLSFSQNSSNVTLTGSSYAHSVRCVAE